MSSLRALPPNAAILWKAGAAAADIHCDRGTALMHAINAIGDAADEKTVRAILVNLVYHDLLTQKAASLMLAATGDSALRLIESPKRDAVRAAILKQMLLTMQT